MTSTRQVLRSLLWPIYIPCFVYATGTAAIIPIVPLELIKLGLSPSLVALVTTLTGVVTVIGPIPVGRLAGRIGERNTLLLGSTLALLSLVGLILSGTWRLLGLFLSMLVILSVGDLSWDLGRQLYLAEKVDPRYRARAMSAFGGSIRVGQVLGPAVGAGALLFFPTIAAFYVHLLAAIFATIIIIFAIAPEPTPMMVEKVQPKVQPAETSAREKAALPVANPLVDNTNPLTSRTNPLVDNTNTDSQRSWQTIFWPLTLVAISALMLSVARINRGLLITLIGHHLGLSAATIMLAFTISAIVDISLFLPGGYLMDRFGRRWVLIWALTVMGIAFLLLPLARGAHSFIGLSIVFSLGNGVGSGIVKTLSADMSPSYHRAHWMGLWNTLTGASLLIGPGIIFLSTSFSGVAAASIATGSTVLMGAIWGNYWLPRLLPPEALGKRRNG